MKKLLLLTTFIAMLMISACSSEQGYTDISVFELQTMMENEEFLFVNTHIPFEGNILGTDLAMPYDEIDQYVSLLPADKDAKIVLYCRSGNMSTIAAKELVKLGYTNVFELDGGFNAWERADLPMEN